MTEQTKQREPELVENAAESSMEQTAEMVVETINNNLEVGNEQIHPHEHPQVTNAHVSTQLHEDSSRETRPSQNTTDIQGLSKAKQLQETDQPSSLSQEEESENSRREFVSDLAQLEEKRKAESEKLAQQAILKRKLEATKFNKFSTKCLQACLVAKILIICRA